MTGNATTGDRSRGSARRRSGTRGGEERFVLGIELALLVALVSALVIADAKLFRVLERVGISWAKGLAPSAVFVAAAWLAVRRARRVLARLRNGGQR